MSSIDDTRLAAWAEHQRACADWLTDHPLLAAVAGVGVIALTVIASTVWPGAWF